MSFTTQPRRPPLAARPDHAAAQKRTLVVLFGSAIFGRAATTLGFAVASLLIKDMLGGATWAGLSTVAITVGTALSASTISDYMNKKGRRPGLVLGYGVAVIGGGVALWGAQLNSIAIFLIGLLLTGVGSGAGNLARYAAADLAHPTRKAKAISFIVFASTIGAVGGPTLVGVADRIGRSAGLAENVGPYGATSLFFAVASVIVFTSLRPDPLELAGGLDSATTPARKSVSDTLRVIVADPLSRLALASLVISQAVMVGVMAMTPLHMDDHGHSISVIGWVISAHTLGMFGFAPVAGWAADRFGQVRSIAFGAIVLVVATALTALARDASNQLMFPGLFLLGLGWSFGMVAGSALLTQSVPDEDRISAQGVADLVAAVVSGTAALASGFVLSAAGFDVLSIIGLIFSALLFGSGVIHGRRPLSAAA